MYIFSAQFCLYYKCFIFLQTKFYVIANYSKVANIMNYFKFIKHNKNVVFRKILINIKIPDSNMSGIFIFILCCSRSKEFRRQGFKANPVCHFILKYLRQARSSSPFLSVCLPQLFCQKQQRQGYSPAGQA